MDMMDGDEMHRLWSLIEDLTNQLSANRQLCESLQAQADQLKGQALHSGTGYALRRFNLDISKEKFESELEQLNAYIVKENQSLAHENKQQALLLREYENTLETVMGKFRSFSHSTQQHTLRLTSHYENLLANTTQNAAETTLAAETSFSGTLSHLGSLVRRAMRAMDGESSDSEEESRPRIRENGWSADSKWYGSGGYTGKDLDHQVVRSEKALDMLTEKERLCIENETLKELLGLKEKSDALAPPPAPSSPRTLALDQASIQAEANGQPPAKALEVSETLRPGETPSERQEKIIEDAILEEEEEIGALAVFDDEEPALAPADAAEPKGPNLVAEAGPSALTSTGIEEDNAVTNTTVSSASGPEEESVQEAADVIKEEQEETIQAEPNMEQEEQLSAKADEPEQEPTTLAETAAEEPKTESVSSELKKEKEEKASSSEPSDPPIE